MHNKSKNMLGFQENIHRKVDSLTHHNNTKFQDKHNIDAEERPTLKQIVKNWMRIKPLLASSRTIKNNEHVTGPRNNCKNTGVRHKTP